ncbi:hypothetical protein VNO78_35223 [Psophocarpus tetragonolobus]|uniref:Uncharacterized protein n=1 Tax=Psophocarpus tetragonolobus TaxID=3891 RepID=A0AAN9NU76_PSOTE
MGRSSFLFYFPVSKMAIIKEVLLSAFVRVKSMGKRPPPAGLCPQTNTLETTGPYGATPLRSEAIPARTNWVFALTNKDNIRMFFVELTGFSSDSGNRKLSREPLGGRGIQSRDTQGARRRILGVLLIHRKADPGFVNQRMRCWKEAGMLPLFLKPTGSTGFTTRTGYRSRTEAFRFGFGASDVSYLSHEGIEGDQPGRIGRQVCNGSKLASKSLRILLQFHCLYLIGNLRITPLWSGRNSLSSVVMPGSEESRLKASTEKEKKDSGQDGDASLSAIGCSSLARGLVFMAHHPAGKKLRLFR